MIRIDRQPARGATISALDLTALIDVVFIVLVFLLLSANPAFMTLDVELPRAEAAATAAAVPVLVEIQAGAAAYRVGDRAFESLETLLPWLDALSADMPVTIAAERDASVERLVQLLSALNARGIPTAEILTELP
jgi:biopolymer transport protein ExbD